MNADEAAASEYTRYHIGGMQPVETVGQKVYAAFVAGVEYGRSHPEKGPS